MTTKNASDASKRDVGSIASWLLSSIVEAKRYENYVLISTPIFYRTGSSVVLRLEISGDLFRLSDDGRSVIEASRAGADKQFEKYARNISKENHITFDGRELFAISKKECLPGVAMLVSNMCATIVNESIERCDFKRHEKYAEYIDGLLIRAFGKAKIAKHPSVRGSSGEEYTPDYGVVYSDRIGYVECVKPSRASIGNAIAMYQDLFMLRTPPICVSAIESLDRFGPKIKLLSGWSQIVDASTKLDVLPRIFESGEVRA